MEQIPYHPVLWGMAISGATVIIILLIEHFKRSKNGK